MTYEQMVERMREAYHAALTGEDFDGSLLPPSFDPYSYDDPISAALDASGLWPVYEAAGSARRALVVSLSCHTSLDWADERAASEEFGRALNAVEKNGG